MEFFDNLLADDATVTLSNIQESHTSANDQVGDMGDDLGERTQDDDDEDEQGDQEVREQTRKRKRNLKKHSGHAEIGQITGSGE